MTNIKPVSLTQNGNPYKKTSAATKTCMAIGTVPMGTLAAGLALSNKGSGKAGEILASGAIMVTLGAVIGKLIGSVIDGQTNKTRMAQADGEAAIAAKNINANA